MDPLVSVIMAVYNGEEYLHAAMDSILNQTFRCFEFIIVDDCSTDSSLAIIQSYRDERIVVIQNDVNIKLAASLNKAIRKAKGKYLVRMDADDISFPDRIEKQVAFMESHPQAFIAFSDLLYFKDNKIIAMVNTNDLSPNGIKATLLFYNVVNHNCTIIRKELFQTYQYNAEYTVTEDLALWIEITKQYKIYYMKENLLLYRIFDTPQSAMKVELQRKQEQKIKLPLLVELMGEENLAMQNIHNMVSQKKAHVRSETLKEYLKFLNRSNLKAELYEESIFKQVLLRMGLVVAINNKYAIHELLSVISIFGLIPLIIFLTKATFIGINDYIQMQVDMRIGRKLL